MMDAEHIWPGALRSIAFTCAPRMRAFTSCGQYDYNTPCSTSSVPSNTSLPSFLPSTTCLVLNQATQFVQAKTATQGERPKSGPTAEERAAAIAALRARQQQKRRASQAADADPGTGTGDAMQLDVAASKAGSGHGREAVQGAMSPERCEALNAVCCV